MVQFLVPAHECLLSWLDLQLTRLTVRQSVQVPVAESTNVTFGGYALQHGGLGAGSMYVSTQHDVSGTEVRHGTGKEEHRKEKEREGETERGRPYPHLENEVDRGRADTERGGSGRDAGRHLFARDLSVESTSTAGVSSIFLVIVKGSARIIVLDPHTAARLVAFVGMLQVKIS